jgi:enoyl-CoA hydratase
VSRVLTDDELLPAALETAARMCGFSPYGLAMTKDIVWVNLENPSLEAAIEIEDRNQLMLGFTDNLPEAIRAFDQGRTPVYTDEPRKDLFAQPTGTPDAGTGSDPKV